MPELRMTHRFATLIAAALLAACGSDPTVPFFPAPDASAADATDAGEVDAEDIGSDSADDPTDLDADSSTDALTDVEPDTESDAEPDVALDAHADAQRDPDALSDSGDAADASVDLDTADGEDADTAEDLDAAEDVDGDATSCPDEGACLEPGSFCAASAATFCELGDDGCLVEIEVRCDLLGEVCAVFDGTAGCYEACEGPAVCDAAFECVDDLARACEESPLGCLVESDSDRCAVDQLCVVEPGRAFCQTMCGDVPACDPAEFARACLDDRDLFSCQPQAGTECFGEAITDCGETGATCVTDATSRCEVLSCGNGAFDEGEECDDGNRLPGDGCNSDCELNDGWFCWLWPSECVESLCGDGTVSRGEGCDDRNADDLDGCSSDCHLEVPPRTSDRPRIVGSLTSTDVLYEAPTPACRDIGLTEFYGDFYWVVNPHEFPVDATFQLDAFTGDTDTLYVFAEDFRPDEPTDSCLQANRTTLFGSTSIQREMAPGEVVVLGASSSERFGTGSYSISVFTGRCGDRRVDSVEGCDDGNTESGDGCSEACEVEPGYSCSLDGLGSVCVEPVCGDGSWGPPVEECDDGNTESGDGCDEFCVLEEGARCAFFETTECVLTVCGDDVLDWGEGCEDGNLIDGDGCDSLCRLEIPDVDESSVTEGRLEPGIDSEFRRPDGSCGGGFLLAYDALTLVNDSAEARSVQAVVAADTSVYVATYTAAFDPAAPGLTCIDSVASLAPPFEMPPVTVAPGEEMVLTIAPFRLDAEAFDWSVEFRGVVPEAP